MMKALAKFGFSSYDQRWTEKAPPQVSNLPTILYYSFVTLSLAMKSSNGKDIYESMSLWTDVLSLTPLW